MIRLKSKLIAILLVLIASTIGSNTLFAPSANALVRNIVFPVIGKAQYMNDFDHSRGSRKHNAIDILANKGQSLVSVVSGTIVDVQYPQPSWGYSVSIQDADGYRYTYIHMNDDNPGSNDGKGGGMHAYAPYVQEGNPVVRGQLIGRVGDSGNSNGVSHLHFEMKHPGGTKLNPFESLNNATRISKPVTPLR